MARLKPLTADALPLPFIDLAAQRARIGPSIERSMARVADHGQFIMGPEVRQLEDALSAFCGAQHAVTCANGTDALNLVLMVEDIGPGDAVLVPSFTFASAVETVVARRATPVFVDVDPATFNIDPDSLERAVAVAGREGLRPRMIIAVDLFGRPADYPALRAYATAHALTLVADAAQSFGADLQGRKAGTLADYTTTSFFPAKPLGCYGDGGAVFTDDDEAADILRSLRLHGRGDDKYEHVRVGLNSRLDTLQAAILLEKLKIFPEEIAARNDAARRYEELLSGLVSTPRFADDATSVWAQYTVILGPDHDRAEVRATCSAAGVPTAIYYPIPMHAQAAYSHFPGDSAGLPQSAMLADRVLSLPMHAYLDPTDQERVADAVRSALTP